MQKIKFNYIHSYSKKKGILTGGIREKKNKRPLFSIISVNLNDDLESTILSIKYQKYRNLIEHIIIDGGSRKGYLRLLKYYNRNIDYWISEKDNGIWDASNKGIKLARGKFIGLLDSGDILSHNASEILRKMQNSKKKNRLSCWKRNERTIVIWFLPKKNKHSFKCISIKFRRFFFEQ